MKFRTGWNTCHIFSHSLFFNCKCLVSMWFRCLVIRKWKTPNEKDYMYMTRENHGTFSVSKYIWRTWSIHLGPRGIHKTILLFITCVFIKPFCYFYNALISHGRNKIYLFGFTGWLCVPRFFFCCFLFVCLFLCAPFLSLTFLFSLPEICILDFICKEIATDSRLLAKKVNVI